MELQTVFDVVVGGAGAFLLWGLKETWGTLESLKKADHLLEVKIAQNHQELTHKFNGGDKFIMANYAQKVDIDKILSHMDKRLDKSDDAIEKLNNKLDDWKNKK